MNGLFIYPPLIEIISRIYEHNLDLEGYNNNNNVKRALPHSSLSLPPLPLSLYISLSLSLSLRVRQTMPFANNGVTDMFWPAVKFNLGLVSDACFHQARSKETE